MYLEELELFPQEIYLIEQFISYEYYYETVKLWEDLIQYAEGLLDRYSENLVANHRSQHLSHQADYVWGTIVLPNFKGTLHHLQSGLDDLKAGFLPILRRMSSITNGIIAQGRDYPYDWMGTVEKRAIDKYKVKENIVFTRANNIYMSSNYYDSQWDYKDLIKAHRNFEVDVGVIYPNPLPQYKLNPKVTMKSDEAIIQTGIYRSIEPYSACHFLIKEEKINAAHPDDWKLAPEVYAFSTNPDNFTTPDTIENSQEVPTTWVLVERVTDGSDADLTPAQPGTRRYFTQGEVLPTLPHTDWGTVYWYFSGEE